VVEHSPHHPKVKGSSLATAAGKGTEKMAIFLNEYQPPCLILVLKDKPTIYALFISIQVGCCWGRVEPQAKESFKSLLPVHTYLHAPSPSINMQAD
jgi:hypothetical protein